MAETEEQKKKRLMVEQAPRELKEEEKERKLEKYGEVHEPSWGVWIGTYIG